MKKLVSIIENTRPAYTAEPVTNAKGMIVEIALVSGLANCPKYFVDVASTSVKHIRTKKIANKSGLNLTGQDARPDPNGTLILACLKAVPAWGIS